MKNWKRMMACLLCLCMALALMACGSASAPATEAPATTQAAPQLRVGYAKVNITPREPMDLWGYAQLAGQRVSTETLDYIYLTCVAITDEQDNTVLMYGADLGDMEMSLATAMRNAVSKATGLPGGNMFFNATHTHSAPDGEALVAVLEKAAVQIAEEALADRKNAEMYFGTADTSGVSFVRHYYETNGAVVTDNHGNTSATEFSGHTTQVDEQMRVLQFKREGGKDVVLVNWQCHPHMTGGTAKTSISADIVGAMRSELENELDCLFAYYQGGAGNLNPTSRIRSEEANTDRNYKTSGKLLAGTAKKALENMTPVEGTAITVVSETHTCKANKEDLDLVDEAQQVVEYYKAGHTSTETKPFAESLGLASYYHAANLVNRGAKPDTFDVELSVVTIGDFAWAMMPGEFFDSTTKYIRDNSPYTYNFSAAYTNGYYGYFPSQECWEYGAYETDISPVTPGEAESIAEHLLQMMGK